MRVMTQRHDDAGGRTGLEIIHGMIADGTPSYLIRREFLKRGSGAGIDNKVVSFTLLLLGQIRRLGAGPGAGTQPMERRSI